MEKAVRKELQQIKGVGEVLAQRLIEAGHDSFAKVAEAGEEGLKKIPGIKGLTRGCKKARKALKRAWA